MDDITLKDIEIILALQQNPFATYEELALATDIPKTTVYEITKKLESSHSFTVVAHPNLPQLGLETIDVFLEADKVHKIQYLEKLALIHPYIAYYARIFGTYSGMYFQFKIPRGTVDLIQNLLQIMKNTDHIDRFTLLHYTTPPINTTFDFHAWNPVNLSWKFSWKQWFGIPASDTENSVAENGSGADSDVKSWLQKRDIAIINQLAYNARRPNTKIRDELSKSKWTINDSTLSRRLKLIKRECISSYRLQIDPRIFDLVNTVLIWGYGTADNIRQMAQRMQSHPIPFLSYLKAENYSFYWYIHLPTYHMSDLLYFLRPIMDEIHLFYVDYPRAINFTMDTDTYNETTKSWITDPHVLVDEVLSKLQDNPPKQ
ncbi:MAG: winged helix-turn-helix transcriptional regulator [Promethearchaeota archaeon]